MLDIILQIIDRFGYLGIVLLIAVENIFPPIPSEVILTFGGFMTTYTKLTVFGVTVFSTVGSLLGAYVLYYIGKTMPPKRMEQLLDGKLGKLLHFKKENVAKSQEWFQKHGNTTVFFCRFVPIIRSLISIPAGMANMDIGIFSLLTVFGSLLWNIILVSLGAFAGSSWDTVAAYIKNYSQVTKLVLLAVALFFIIKWLRVKFSH